MTSISTNAPGTVALSVNTLTTRDLTQALADGWRDFTAAPLYGLMFAAVYVAGGLALYFGLVGAGQPVWFVLIAAGFPLFAPFAAIGLYEISRRRQDGLPLSLDQVLGAMRGRGDGQFAMAAAFVLIAFGFWVILARVVFALFLGQSGVGFDSTAALLQGPGLTMLAVGTLVGGVVAFVVFSATAFGLPMLLDRPVDVVTALLTSIDAVRANLGVMLIWAGLIAALTFAAMLPWFAGLFVVLPVLGHATWHLYRRAIN